MRTILILSIVFLTGCTFTRSLKVTVDGAKAKKYGAVEEARFESYWRVGLFK